MLHSQPVVEHQKLTFPLCSHLISLCLYIQWDEARNKNKAHIHTKLTNQNKIFNISENKLLLIAGLLLENRYANKKEAVFDEHTTPTGHKCRRLDER